MHYIALNFFVPLQTAICLLDTGGDFPWMSAWLSPSFKSSRQIHIFLLFVEILCRPQHYAAQGSELYCLYKKKKHLGLTLQR